jgi:hypothetical protein
MYPFFIADRQCALINCNTITRRRARAQHLLFSESCNSNVLIHSSLPGKWQIALMKTLGLEMLESIPPRSGATPSVTVAGSMKTRSVSGPALPIRMARHRLRRPRVEFDEKRCRMRRIVVCYRPETFGSSYAHKINRIMLGSQFTLTSTENRGNRIRP